MNSLNIIVIVLCPAAVIISTQFFLYLTTLQMSFMHREGVFGEVWGGAEVEEYEKTFII